MQGALFPAIDVANVKQWPYCIKSHTAAARRQGTSTEELMEAIRVAAERRAGGSFALSILAMTEIEKFAAPEAG